MRSGWRRPALLLLVAVAWSGCATVDRAATPAPAPADTARVTLLHINDTHGHLEPHDDWGRSVGGYSRLATLVRQERSASLAARVFLIHAGDILSRGDDLTRATLGAANFEVLNHLKFDLWTPGNGDFYDGVDTLQARIRQARFPALAANVKVKATGQPLAQAYVIEQAGPVRLAFFGLCFLQPRHPESYAQFICADPTETAARLVPDLRRQADIVVAVTHLGYADDRSLAEHVAGIDVILGAHSHTLLPTGARVRTPDGGETLICQTGEHLGHLGRVTLECSRVGGAWRLVNAVASVTAVDDKVPADPAVTALVSRLAEEAGVATPAQAR